MRLAVNELRSTPFRTLLTLAAIAAAIAVILVLRGFEQGLYAQSRSIVMSRGADLFVTQAGIHNLVAARSALPQFTRGLVEDIPGVATAHPLTGLPVIYDQDGLKTPSYLLIYDTKGGPNRITQGTAARSGNDIVLDLSLADKYGLRPGDTLTLAAFDFRITGITTGNAALFMPFLFTTYDGLIDFFLDSEIAPDLSTFPLLSYLLIELRPGADRTAVAREIEARIPEADVLTPSQLADNDAALGKELFGPVMGAMISIAYVIGGLVVALIMYADVRRRQRSFAVMKALGFSQGRITLEIGTQVLILVIIAFPMGMAIAQLMAMGIAWWAPIYRVLSLEPYGLVQTLVGLTLFAGFGALLPLRLVAKADPVTAFQDG